MSADVISKTCSVLLNSVEKDVKFSKGWIIKKERKKKKDRKKERKKEIKKKYLQDPAVGGGTRGGMELKKKKRKRAEKGILNLSKAC